MFYSHVQNKPDKIAIKFNECALTYKQLFQKAYNVAQILHCHGVGTGKIAGIMTNHSIESVVGIIGILMTGAAYLPIDPLYPTSRIDYMLGDCCVTVLLHSAELPTGLYIKGTTICLNNLETRNDEFIDLSMTLNPDDLAYVIYTSGSTGNPKGVMISHESLANYIMWAKNEYIKYENEIFPLFTSLAFDLTITSIFLPLAIGGCILVYRDNQPGDALIRILDENLCTIIKLTPSHLIMVSDKDYSKSNIHTIIVGGEILSKKTAQSAVNAFKDNVSIYNEYGPTETTIGCTCFKF